MGAGSTPPPGLSPVAGRPARRDRLPKHPGHHKLVKKQQPGWKGPTRVRGLTGQTFSNRRARGLWSRPPDGALVRRAGRRRRSHGTRLHPPVNGRARAGRPAPAPGTPPWPSCVTSSARPRNGGRPPGARKRPARANQLARAPAEPPSRRAEMPSRRRRRPPGRQRRCRERHSRRKVRKSTAAHR